MITCQDWAQLPPSRILPLLHAEERRWLDVLGWDIRPSWAVIEPARAAGQVPGLVAWDADGRVRGWTFFVPHHDTLQVGAFVSDAPAVTRALIESLSASEPAGEASTAILFALDGAPGLAKALLARGFALETYQYMSRGTEPGSADVAMTHAAIVPELRPWRAGDRQAVARLAQQAYQDSGVLRPFAPDGEPEEWDEYLTQLVSRSGCGRFLPSASFVAADPASRDLAGAVVTTSIDRSTAHLAQVCVDPSARGRRIGQRLVQAACAEAAAHGHSRITLLVASANTAALALYARLGFQPTASFLAGLRRQPRRLTNAALATGGASTFR